MGWLLVSRRSHLRAAAWTGAGVAAGALAALLGGLAVAPGTLAWASLGFVAFVLCAGRALRLWRLDEMVFDHPGKAREGKGRLRPADPSRFKREGSSGSGVMSDRIAFTAFGRTRDSRVERA